LFTDIARALPEAEHVMFDYNQVDEIRNELTVSSLAEQTSRLARIIAEIRNNYVDLDINLIGHSQGCIVAALLKPLEIRHTVLLAPPSELSSASILGYFGQIPGAQMDRHSLTKFPRREGSTTIVPPDYWPSVDGLDPVGLYNDLAKVTSLTIVDAQDDEVLLDKDFSAVDNSASMISLSANHDFTGDSRPQLLGELTSFLS
jgi:pimeloyl-ACP methyl ester carboxylesterase